MRRLARKLRDVLGAGGEEAPATPGAAHGTSADDSQLESPAVSKEREERPGLPLTLGTFTPVRASRSGLEASSASITRGATPQTTVEWLRRATATLDDGDTAKLLRAEAAGAEVGSDEGADEQENSARSATDAQLGGATAEWGGSSPEPAAQDAAAGGGVGGDAHEHGEDLSGWFPPAAENPAFLGAQDGPLARAAPLEERATAQLQAIVRQELAAEGGLSSESREAWAPVVASLARGAAASLRATSAQTAQRMHPKHYVKIKRLPWGAREDSRAVAGIACRKNVAHRQMRSSVSDCRVLLLRGRLEYQRGASRLSSIETVMEQEQGYLRVTVKRIAALRPDVLLVGGSVSRLARDLLLQEGVALVLNVRDSLMDRVARATGAEVLQSADDLITRESGLLLRAIGMCGSFYIEPMQSTAHLTGKENASVRTLMFFERCPVPLGHTLLLHGPAGELDAVKRATSTAVLAAHHLHLECALLADEAAVFSPSDGPPTPSKLLSISPHVSFELPLSYGSAQAPRLSAIQHIHISLHTDATATPAAGGVYEGPSLRRLDFYDVADAPLGHFVLSALQSAMRNEGNDAGVLKPRWLCTYAHGTGLLTMHTLCVPPERVLPQDGNIWIWCCPRGQAAPAGPQLVRRRLSEAAGASSFGVFLDEAFNASTLTTLSHPDISLHHGQDRIFASGGAALRVRYMPVRVRRVRLPPRFPERDPASWAAHVGEEAGLLVEVARDAFDTVRESLARLDARLRGTGNSDTSLPEANLARLRSLVESVGGEERVFSSKLTDLGLPPLRPPSEAALKEREVRQALLNRLIAADTDVDASSPVAGGVATGGSSPEGSESGEEQSKGSDSSPDRALPDPFELYRLLRLLAATMRTWVSTLADFEASMDPPPRHRRGNSSGGGSGDAAASNGGGIDGSVPTRKSSVALTSSRGEAGDASEASGEQREGRMHRRSSSLSSMNLAATAATDGVAVAASAGAVAPESSMAPELGGDAGAGVVPRIQRAPSAAMLAENVPSDNVPGSPSLRASEGRHRRGKSLDPHSAATSGGFSRFSIASFGSDGPSPTFLGLLPSCGRIMASPGVDDTVIPIHDDEPTSVIAHALASQDYGRKLVAARRAAAAAAPAAPSSAGGAGPDPEPSHSTPPASPLHRFDTTSVESRAKPPGSSGPQWSAAQRDTLRSSMESSEPTHVRFTLNDDGVSSGRPSSQYAVTVYYAAQFDAMRRLALGNADFVRSLCRCRKWHPRGGKSGAFFAKSWDDRFVIKQLGRTELIGFLGFAPSYFQYVARILCDEGNGETTASALAKVFGVYQVTVKLARGNGEIKMDLLVMENLLYGRTGRVERIYDLKGSMRSRYIRTHSDDEGDGNQMDGGVVLQDENLVEASREAPIYVEAAHAAALERAVWNDTAFLSALGVMDYSMLVAVVSDPEEIAGGGSGGQLIVGIIDWVRQYTWDKQVETWVKSSALLGGSKDGAAPTVISPAEYKDRFRSQMAAYFPAIPTQLTHLPASESADAERHSGTATSSSAAPAS